MIKFNPYNPYEVRALRDEIGKMCYERGLTALEAARELQIYTTKRISDVELAKKIRSQRDCYKKAMKHQNLEKKFQTDPSKAENVSSVELSDKEIAELEEKGFITLSSLNGQKEALYDGEFYKKTIVTLDGSLITEEILMRAHNLDPLCWKIIDHTSNSWQSQTKEGRAITLLQSKIRVKPIVGPDGGAWKQAFEKTIEMMAKDDKNPEPISKRSVQNGDDLAICCIADLHLGKLGVGSACGAEYNSKIAEENFNYIIDEYIRQFKSYDNLGKIIFYWCQDFFHYDNRNNTTTRGTKQDTDTIWPVMLTHGCELLARAINRLKKVAPVETMYVCSNHDEHTGFAAALFLEGLFRNDEMVTVNIAPTTRKYFRWGNGLYGFAHGDKEGKRIAAMMQIEARKAWGVTLFHEWFLGHFHSEHIKDDGGVVMRYLGSPTGTDAWHSQSGYVGATREAQLFIRNKVTGPVTNIPIIIPTREILNSEIDMPEYEGWVEVRV